MTSLLDDFHGHEPGKSSKLPQSRKDKLQAELKVLEWHKMANAAAIKSALLQTKTLKASIPQKPTPQHTTEDEKWIKKVIQQEHIKPLEVSKDFVIDYESREKENAERLSSQVERHIHTLKQLRQKLEARHDMKARNEEYRSWQREFQPKKQAVMIGKTLEEVAQQRAKAQSAAAQAEQQLDSEIQDDLIQRAAYRKMNSGKAPQQSSQELNTVLDSLSRLADLENRITSLERENQYDALLAQEGMPAHQRSSVEFNEHKMYPTLTGQGAKGGAQGGVEIRKRRGQADKSGPVGVKYEVRSRDPLLGNQHNSGKGGRQWQVKMPSGSGANAVRSRRNYEDEDYEEDEEYDEDADADVAGYGGKKQPGVFITAGMQSEEQLPPAKVAAMQRREQQKMERLRAQHAAPGGVRQLQGRVQQKRVRAQERAVGDKKHAAAMAEMQRRKQSLAQGVGAAARNTAKKQQQQQQAQPRKGAAGGMKTKNKHLAAFQQEKKQFERRREDVQRGAAAARRPARTNTNNNGSVQQRLVSQTAPVYAAPRVGGSKQQQSSGGARGGAMTRRVQQPAVHRSQQPQGVAGGGFAVQGIGGLRALKANQQPR